MRGAVLAAALLAALGVWARPHPAAAAPPLVVADPARPSAIELTESSSYLLGIGPTGSADNVVCFVFVNHGAHTATKVGLSLAMVDATGMVAGVDVMYPTGKFFSGARSAFSGSRDTVAVPNGNCHLFVKPRPVAGSTISYRVGPRNASTDITAIVVSAREIVYDDGTVWRNENVPQTGDRVVLPSAAPAPAVIANGPPAVAPLNVPGSPMEVTDAFRYESVDTVRSGNYVNVVRGRGGVCAVFTNHDPRTVKRVSFDVSLADRKGAIVDVRLIDARGKFSTGVPIDNANGSRRSPGEANCTAVPGVFDADSFMIKPNGPTAAPVAVGRIAITPSRVEFTDGTTWVAPSPPKVGDRIARP